MRNLDFLALQDFRISLRYSAMKMLKQQVRWLYAADGHAFGYSNANTTALN